MLGNGFDLGLGLHTRYTDFLNKRYLEKTVKRGSPIDKMLVEISKNAECWGDAEIAFGRLPFSEFGTTTELSFVECERDFHLDLCSYLSDEESRLVIPEQDRGAVSDSFSRAISELFFKLAEGPQRRYVSSLIRDNTHVINFVNFNYTGTLETVLGDVSPRRVLYEITSGTDVELKFTLGDIVHVHGDLKSGNTIFGVSECEQILDEEMVALCEEEGYFIKSSIDEKIGQNRGEQVRQILESSDIVVTYGLSFGESDVHWWEFLLNCSRRNPSLSLILCPFRCDGPEEKTQNDIFYEKALAWRNFKRNIDVGVNQNALRVLKTHVHIVLPGNHREPDGRVEYCDPLCLKWIGKNYVRYYVDGDKKYAQTSTNPVVAKAIDAHNQRIESQNGN